MTFAIEFLPKLEADKRSAKGEIVIDDFIEKFESELTFWKTEDYIRQWVEGIERIIHMTNNSCLITSISNPDHANFILWWVMYKQDNMILFQNQILFFELLDQKFSLDNPYIHVPKRMTVNEDGKEISEWSVPLQEIKNFLKQQM